ncbi:hypothetical protein GO755_31035 [Spirosoma sp. HMF4905]|uniref:Uncharacterized protein n=1 Tax=Spirosoma arboris TaxID=2682092 RepID=A0A7K1SL46_9BACT|nr:hypothetical protein [Spirosoma arboris]MVM34505.1 hypothetical protein [Spirosoma arboris]
MKRQYYNFWVYQLLGLLMALNVINLSIGVRDTALLTSRTVAYHEDLSVNKIESIGEFLLEECFGFYDAVPEHDDPDDESEVTELEQDYDFHPLFVFAPILAPVRYLITESRPFTPASIPAHIQEIVAPPPQILV